MLYMVILLISEFDPEFPICQKKKGGLVDIIPATLGDTSRAFP